MLKEKIKDFCHAFSIVLFGFFILFIADFIIGIFSKDNNINIIEKFFTLDAYWYESIVKDGYMKFSDGDPNNKSFVLYSNNGMANWAFFPLLPLVIKIIMTMTFNMISIENVAFMFSSVCFVFVIYNLIRYLKEKNIDIKYNLIFLIFLFNPAMMFFYTLYTESLTMLLIILLIRACDKKKYLAGGLLCSLLSFIKVQGSFWCIYLFIKVFKENYIKGKNAFFSIFLTLKKIVKNPICFLSICLSPLGLFSFLLILKSFDLHVLSFYHIQSAWGKENGFFLYTIFKGLFVYTNIEAAFCVFYIIFVIYLFVKKKYLSFTMLSIYLLSSTTSSVASVTRYMIGSVIFPLELYFYLLKNINLGKTKIVQNFKNISISIMFYFYKLVFVPIIIAIFLLGGIPLLY